MIGKSLESVKAAGDNIQLLNIHTQSGKQPNKKSDTISSGEESMSDDDIAAQYCMLACPNVGSRISPEDVSAQVCVRVCLISARVAIFYTCMF